MKKLLIAACVALSACGLDVPPQGVPAVQQVQINDETLTVAWHGFEFGLTAVDILRDSGKLRPGTAPALAVADTIAATRTAFDIAGLAAKSGDVQGYREALQRAQVGINGLKLMVLEYKK